MTDRIKKEAGKIIAQQISKSPDGKLNFEELHFEQTRGFLKIVGSYVLLLAIFLIIPVSVYFILRNELEFNQKESIKYSIIFYICWLIFAGLLNLFNYLSSKLSSKK